MYVFQETVVTNNNKEQPDTVRVSVMESASCIILSVTDGSDNGGQAFIAVTDVAQLVDTLLRAQAQLEKSEIYQIVKQVQGV